MVVVIVRMTVWLGPSGAETDAANVMMMAGLRRPSIGFVADDLRAVFAELSVHHRRTLA